MCFVTEASLLPPHRRREGERYFDGNPSAPAQAAAISAASSAFSLPTFLGLPSRQAVEVRSGVVFGEEAATSGRFGAWPSSATPEPTPSAAPGPFGPTLASGLSIACITTTRPVVASR